MCVCFNKKCTFVCLFLFPHQIFFNYSIMSIYVTYYIRKKILVIHLLNYISIFFLFNKKTNVLNYIKINKKKKLYFKKKTNKKRLN